MIYNSVCIRVVYAHGNCTGLNDANSVERVVGCFYVFTLSLSVSTAGS